MASPTRSRALKPFVCQSCRQRLLSQVRRPFTTSATRKADNSSNSTFDPAIAGLGRLSNQITRDSSRQRSYNSPYRSPTKESSSPYTDILDQTPESLFNEDFGRNLDAAAQEKPHRLHVFATKHNTHISFVQPPRSAADTASSRIAGAKVTAAEQKKQVDVLFSLSAGNIGFRKAGRGSYDAAFQLAAFALKQMQDKGMLRDCNSIEVVLRGFGAGREAVTKALLGTEGRLIRTKISSVKDATRLKQGGARSKKPRRLG